MTKITHIFKTYFPETNGGLEEAIRQIGRHSAAEGYRVEVVAAGMRSYQLETADGVTARFFKTDFDCYSNPFSFSLAGAFRSICKSTDIIHYHFTWPTAELLTLLNGNEKPMLVTFHCDIHKNKFLKTLYLPVVKKILRRADKICVTSKNLFDSTPYLAEFKDKTEAISLWFDENRFSHLPAPDSYIKQMVGDIGNYGLFVGVLRWYKGLDVLLEASKKVDAHIVIVGKGPLLNHLKKRIKKENLDNVHLLGFQPDNNLKFLIQKSRFIVLPSTTAAEAFGQILLEGLYFSIPLISTELGTGTSLVNQNNHTGLVVAPGCPDSLSRAMNRMFHDHIFHDRCAGNAFHHYKTNFSESVQGHKYSHIYNSLAKKGVRSY